MPSFSYYLYYYDTFIKINISYIITTLLSIPIHGILQTRILEWVPFSSVRDLPNQGIKPWPPALQADSLLSEPPGNPQTLGLRGSGGKSKFNDKKIWKIWEVF